MFTGPDRTHPDGMDDSAQCDARPSIHHARRRASRAPRWRNWNSLDNNGMREAGAATGSSGTPGPGGRRTSASAGAGRQRESLKDDADVIAQFVEGGTVRFGARPDEHVTVAKVLQQFSPDEFAQPSLHRVPRHRGAAELRYDDPHPTRTRKGSVDPDIAVRGPDPLPFTSDLEDLPRAHQPAGARKATSIRCRRTSRAAER